MNIGGDKVETRNTIFFNFLIILVFSILFYAFQDYTLALISLALLVVIQSAYIWSNNIKHKEILQTKEKSMHRQIEFHQKSKALANHYLESFMNTLKSRITRINSKGLFRQSNTIFDEMFPNHPLINRHYDLLKIYPPLYLVIQKSFITQSAQNKQITIDDLFYEIDTTPLFDGEIFTGILVVIDDITRLKTAEQFQKQFTADVSHELRNPLSTIKGFSEILSREHTKDLKEIKRFSLMIFKESLRLETIIKDLLIIAKMDRLDYQLNIKEKNIKLIIQEIIDLYYPQIIDKGLTLKTSISSCLLEVDEEKIKQVLINILTNAIHYTDKGTIEISSLVDDNYYSIIFTDSGIGIAPEDQQKIFKRFYRVDEARARDKGGSGLGLSITKNVIHKHGGLIELQSALGKGTKITIKIPNKTTRSVTNEKI